MAEVISGCLNAKCCLLLYLAVGGDISNWPMRKKGEHKKISGPV